MAHRGQLVQQARPARTDQTAPLVRLAIPELLVQQARLEPLERPAQQERLARAIQTKAIAAIKTRPRVSKRCSIRWADSIIPQLVTKRSLTTAMPAKIPSIVHSP